MLIRFLILLSLSGFPSLIAQVKVDLSNLAAIDRSWIRCNGLQVASPGGYTYATPQCPIQLGPGLPAQPPLTQGPVTFSGGRLVMYSPQRYRDALLAGVHLRQHHHVLELSVARRMLRCQLA
jgi:hypothetical protein